MDTRAYAFLAGYLNKEAGIGKVIKSVTKNAPKKKAKLPSYNNVKRYLSRNPALPDVIPEAAKKIKKNKAGDVTSFLNPKSGYKHTKDAPSLLSTIGNTAIKSPRLFKNPSLDKGSQLAYKGLLAAGAGKGIYEGNEKRMAHDTNVQSKADTLRGYGQDTLADLTEQAKSGNVLSRLIGQNKYKIPEGNFLEPLNNILGDANMHGVKEALKYGAHEIGGNTQKDPRILKKLFKPPITSSGVVGKTVSNVLGEPKSQTQVGQSILKSALTPENVAKMSKSPNGRIILAVLQQAKTIPADKIEEYTSTKLQQAKQLWEELVANGTHSMQEIEAKVTEALMY